MRFLYLSEEWDAARWIPQILPSVAEAGDPYYRWFFDGVSVDGRPEEILAGWMRRRSSEVSVERTVLLVTEACAVGGFIALGGRDLQACRRADTLAALQTAGRDRRDRVAERIRQSQQLFAPVAEDEFYLSKLWVATAFRRMGHGGSILREYLRTGVNRGFRRFRLDVWAQNQPAVALYRKAGFATLREPGSDPAGMAYLNMAVELPPR